MTSPTISLDARPVLSYAMAHNEIPVISRLAIENVPRDLPAALLRLDVTDATGLIADSQEVLLDLQAGRPTVLTDLRLLLDPAAMLQVEEQRPGRIRARLEVDGQVVSAAECRDLLHELALLHLGDPPAGGSVLIAVDHPVTGETIAVATPAELRRAVARLRDEIARLEAVRDRYRVQSMTHGNVLLFRRQPAEGGAR